MSEGTEVINQYPREGADMSNGAWDGIERRASGQNGRRCVDVNSECVQRTADAIAQGKEWKTGLERDILIAKHERENQMAKLAEIQNRLADAQTMMMQSITTLSNTVANDHDLVIVSQQQLKEMQEWQVKESAKRDTEEANKRAALEKLESERKERMKPWQETLWRIVQTAVIFLLGAIATAVWRTYFTTK